MKFANPITARMIKKAYANLNGFIDHTPLEFNERLSKKYNCKIFLKREDLQNVRSYKIRGAYNLISSLAPKEKKRGVVCASAGNHAQGVALSCSLLKIKGVIFMPKPTPKQKIDRVMVLGGKFVEIKLLGDTFDEANQIAKDYCLKENKIFVHPFDDIRTIAGQGTVAVEILKQSKEKIDAVVVPVGGGGLISGLGTYFRALSPKTRIFGAEPAGAPSMRESLRQNKILTLESIDKFVDGAAVKRPGEITFEICRGNKNKILLIPEGKVCREMLDLYQKDGIVAEPAGALSVAALDEIAPKLKGKKVVCVLSGGNNDVSRYAEITERALVYQGLKHYFIIEFSQRPGVLRKYLDEVLGENDDIVLFEYVKKNNRESGPALIGIELSKKENLTPLLSRMDNIGLAYEIIKPGSALSRFLI